MAKTRFSVGQIQHIQHAQQLLHAMEKLETMGDFTFDRQLTIDCFYKLAESYHIFTCRKYFDELWEALENPPEIPSSLIARGMEQMKYNG